MTIGGLVDLCALPGVPSAPTVRALLRRRADFPVIQRGSKRTPYLFDLDRAAAFVRANWGDARLRKSYGSPVEPDRQLRLMLDDGDHR